MCSRTRHPLQPQRINPPTGSPSAYACPFSSARQPHRIRRDISPVGVVTMQIWKASFAISYWPGRRRQLSASASQASSVRLPRKALCPPDRFPCGVCQLNGRTGGVRTVPPHLRSLHQGMVVRLCQRHPNCQYNVAGICVRISI
jgi:hypothetical protein